MLASPLVPGWYYKSCDGLCRILDFNGLKTGRLAKGLSQVDAARRLEVSPALPCHARERQTPFDA